MKKRIAIINAVPYGSTGKITRGIYHIFKESGFDVFLAYGWTKKRGNTYESDFKGHFLPKALNIFLSKISGFEGCFAFFDTLRLVQGLKKFRPNCISLHIIHSWSFNLPVLMNYIKKSGVPIIWTFHDCWAFTGHCPNFTSISCEKWKNICYKCPVFREYPFSTFDNSNKMWKLKRKWFTGIDNLTIVAPSNWMQRLVKQSFLKEYDVLVCNNGIDLSVFCPQKSSFRSKYNCENKILVLGVALIWTSKKGLDTFIWLSNSLPTNYQIVLVGEIKELDENRFNRIISIPRTETPSDLAQIYSAADVFVNPTLEDNFPTVNLESIACGTPVISYRTGGCEETFNNKCGISIDYNRKDDLLNAILKVCSLKKQPSKSCVEYAKRFDIRTAFKKYVDLVTNLVDRSKQ